MENKLYRLVFLTVLIFFAVGVQAQRRNARYVEYINKYSDLAVGSLTQPLFARGQVIAQYRIARAQQEEASLAFQQTLLNAGSEVNDALTAWQTSLSKSELLDKQVASLQTAARSTSLLLEHGNTTYLEVLTARQTLLNAQLAQTANRFSEIQSLINLYKALGGGQE